MFITKPTKPSRFFKNGLPCDSAVETVFQTSGISHIKLNDTIIINKLFSKREQFWKNPTKWVNYKYPIKDILRTLLLLSFPNYSSILNHHMPFSSLKSTFEEVWAENEILLNETSNTKFRKISDVNQYLFRYWQLVSGKFTPVSMRDCKNLELFDGNDSNKGVDMSRVEYTCDIIKKQKFRMICLNDGYSTEEQFLDVKNRINESFQYILPNKSSFEL